MNVLVIGQEVTDIVNEHHEHGGDVQLHVHSSKLLEGHDKMNINERHEHFLTEEINSLSVVSNDSYIIQYTCDIPKTNDIVLANNVHDVHYREENILKHVKEQHLIMP